jgi:universal stress protein F
MTKPILVAVDLEHMDSATTAVEEAEFVARSRKAPLHVCYVLPFVHYGYITPMLPKELLDDTAARAHAALDGLIASVGAIGLDVRPHVLRGGISEQVLLLASRIGAGHILLNARRKDANGYATGANAAQIARHATCSVTILR